MARGHIFVVAACAALGTLGGCGQAESSKPAGQILNDSAAALRRVHSLRVSGTQYVDNRRTAITVAVDQPAKASVTEAQGPAAAALIVIGTDVYIKANPAFLKQQGGGVTQREAELLANRWIKLPASSGGPAADLTKKLEPATLSRCLAENHGTLSLAGRAMVGGRPAVVIRDAGDRPGSTPGKLYVAASGAPLPLRAVTTGPQRPGGHRDPACEGGRDSAGRAGDSLTLSDYDKPLDISPPPGALDLTQATPGAEQQ